MSSFTLHAWNLLLNLSYCRICVSAEMKQPVEMILSFIPRGWWEYLLSMLSRTYLLK